MLPRWLPLLLALALPACKEEPPPPPPDPCPNISMDTLNGDWIKAVGKRGDYKNRFRVFGGPDHYEAYLVPGFFDHLHMIGKKREHDVVFDEQLSPDRLEKWRAGELRRFRMYVTPHHPTCALRVVIDEVWMVDGKEKETPRTRGGHEEFLPFPEGQDVVFSYRPPDGPLFLGPAAKSRAKAEAQLKRLGEPDPGYPLGEAIPVGVFTRAEEDGPSSCTYTMDLYFDDQLLKDRRNLPAGEVKGGWRHWYVPDWYAPYSGNHHFEIYRYRQCGGGERELIGVNAIEAVLS